MKTLVHIFLTFDQYGNNFVLIISFPWKAFHK